MAQRPCKALIIGAGIAGPATAILLKRAGFDAELYEAWPYSTGIGGGLQIAPNGMHVLAELGLADELIRHGSVCESFDFYSQSGRRLGSINRNMKQRFGQPAVNMCRATLNEMLVDKAWSDGVEVHFEKRLVKIEDRAGQPVVLHFSDGTNAEGDFVIGADGVHSAAREPVVPDGPRPFDTGLIGFGGFVPRSVLENNSVGQRVETTFGQCGFFGYGYCSPDPNPRRDVVEHAAFARHRRRDVPLHGAGRIETAFARFPYRLARSDPAHHRCRREHRGHRYA